MQRLKGQTSVHGNSFVQACLRHSLYALALACLLPVVASAYTIVMRGGRHIEAPANFVVTQTTLTYEAATGLNVTLPLAEIDIAATEQANNEAPGSLLRRATVHQPQATATQASNGPHATRTLTNRELEPLRRARIERERAEDERRKALGLPPVPKPEPRSNDEEAQALRDLARHYEAEQAQAENYRRERAADLRAEILALDDELNYLRAQPVISDYDYAPDSTLVVSEVGPFLSSRRVRFGRGPQFGGPFAFRPIAPRGRAFFNMPRTNGVLRQHTFGPRPVRMFAH
jgi:hypothetical protein